MRQGTSGFINVFWPHLTDRNPYTPTIRTLLEWLLRHLRPPEDGSHLPKHVGVNLEYINKSTSSLTHLLVILQRSPVDKFLKVCRDVADEAYALSV
jgi:hypothetical protein